MEVIYPKELMVNYNNQINDIFMVLKMLDWRGLANHHMILIIVWIIDIVNWLLNLFCHWFLWIFHPKFTDWYWFIHWVLVIIGLWLWMSRKYHFMQIDLHLLLIVYLISYPIFELLCLGICLVVLGNMFGWSFVDRQIFRHSFWNCWFCCLEILSCVGNIHLQVCLLFLDNYPMYIVI